MGFTPCKAEQRLRGIELQEKKHEKDYRIHKICLKKNLKLQVFNISSATAEVAPDLLKALAILSDTTVRRSAGNREDLIIILEIRKKTTVL